jgi:hypothetical protein
MKYEVKFKKEKYWNAEHGRERYLFYIDSMFIIINLIIIILFSAFKGPIP